MSPLLDPESGLDNFGARFDASNLGRFMTPDWAARPTTVPYAVLGDPQSLNLYGYVRNDPVSMADADGHEYQPGEDLSAAYDEKFGPPTSTSGKTTAQRKDQQEQAQNQATADKPAPQPAPTDPNGKPTPPPVKVPGAPDLPWKWNPNPQNPRGGTWGPDGWKGPNPPNGVWDPSGHWDINGGKGEPVDHYDPKGNPITPGEAHPGNIQLPSAKQIVIGIGAVGTGYLIYRGVRMLPSVVFPPLWPTIPLNAAIP